MYYVYKLNCKEGVYIGVTTNLRKRLNSHKTSKHSGNYKYESYEVLAVTFSKELAYRFEDIGIAEYGTINKRRSGLINKNHAGYMKAYRASHPEYVAKGNQRHREYMKERRENA